MPSLRDKTEAALASTWRGHLNRRMWTTDEPEQMRQIHAKGVLTPIDLVKALCAFVSCDGFTQWLLTLPGIPVNGLPGTDLPIGDKISKNRSDDAALLMAHSDFDAHALNQSGVAALHLCVKRGSPDAVKTLTALLRRPDLQVNQRSRPDGSTPFMCIVELQYRYAATQLARVLLEDPRLDLDAKDGAGRTVDDLLRLSVADLRRKHLYDANQAVLDLVVEERARRGLSGAAEALAARAGEMAAIAAALDAKLAEELAVIAAMSVQERLERAKSKSNRHSCGSGPQWRSDWRVESASPDGRWAILSWKVLWAAEYMHDEPSSKYYLELVYLQAPEPTARFWQCEWNSMAEASWDTSSGATLLLSHFPEHNQHSRIDLSPDIRLVGGKPVGLPAALPA